MIPPVFRYYSFMLVETQTLLDSLGKYVQIQWNSGVLPQLWLIFTSVLACSTQLLIEIHNSYISFIKNKILYLEKRLSQMCNAKSSTRRQLAKFIVFKMFSGPAAKFVGPVNGTGPGGWEMLLYITLVFPNLMEVPVVSIDLISFQKVCFCTMEYIRFI